MRRAFELINQNCRVATRLVSDAQERSLTRLERWGLAIHLGGCRSCRRYRRQILLLEKMMAHALAHPTVQRMMPDSSKQRLARRLADACRNQHNH
jgi:predicted anti-sigma-YlaC factor YlaD